jgi:membrane protease YdiL (CAAX protease family)
MLTWVRAGVFIAGSLALTAGISALALATARWLRQWRLDINLLVHPSQLAAYGMMILLCLGLMGISGLPPARFGLQSMDWKLDAALGAGIGLALPAPLNWLVQVCVRKWGPGVYSPALMRAILPRSRREWLFVPLAFCLTALSEELLFRAIWVGGFSRWLPAAIPVLVGSAIFGITHLAQGRLGMAAAGALGLLFAGLFLWRQSILPCFLAHYLVNLGQVWYASQQRAWLENYPDNG